MTSPSTRPRGPSAPATSRSSAWTN